MQEEFCCSHILFCSVFWYLTAGIWETREVPSIRNYQHCTAFSSYPQALVSYTSPQSKLHLLFQLWYTALNLPVAVARREKCAQSCLFFFFLRVIHFNNQRVKPAKKSHRTVFKIVALEVQGACVWGLWVGEIPLTKCIRKMEWM